jgi:hypothetical protein
MKLRLWAPRPSAPSSRSCCATAHPTWRSSRSAHPTPTGVPAGRSACTWSCGFPEGLPPTGRTFYSLTTPDGRPLLVDAWGGEVQP